jgi:hypothetical protein
MKNTLAENMLRFGPKNLTQENRENLKRLTEDFVKNGITYKLNFKDDAAFGAYITGAPVAELTAKAPGGYDPHIGPAPKETGDPNRPADDREVTASTQRANKILKWNNGITNLFNCYWIGCAFMGKSSPAVIVSGTPGGDTFMFYITRAKAAIDAEGGKYQAAISFLQDYADIFSKSYIDPADPNKTKTIKYIDWFNTYIYKPEYAKKSTIPLPAPAVVPKPVKKN